MNAVAQVERPAILIPGAVFGGGFFAGYVRSGEQNYAIIVAPKAEGEHEDAPWNKTTKMVDGAQSFNDGRANTAAMAAAGSALAKWILALNINGCNDWYLPSRDELEVCYRNLKPTIDENWVHRNGENPSSLPVGFPYTAQNPLQTEAEAFQEGQPEAFDAVWYWSSTQHASYAVFAWSQFFGDGSQGYARKGYGFRARAVRRLPI